MKQQEVTHKAIGGIDFYITPFSAFTSARISGDLASVLAPVLGSFAPLVKGMDPNEVGNKEAGDKEAGDKTSDNDIMNMDMEEALPAISGALSQLDGDKIERLMKELLINYKNIAYDNEDGETERLTFDSANEVFCGEFQDMLLLCWEVIKINFGGFFKKIAGRSGNLREFTEQAKKRLKMGKTGSTNGESST